MASSAIRSTAASWRPFTALAHFLGAARHALERPGSAIAESPHVPPRLALFARIFAFFLAANAIFASSRSANAEPSASRNLDVTVIVSRTCTVSTERGVAGAELDEGCPQQIQQSLVRELFVRAESPLSGPARVEENLVLVVNF
jgi:hypothetical protein